MALNKSHLTNPEVFFATGAGVGFLPKAPGTWGSMLAVGVWWWLLSGLAWYWQVLIVGVTFLLGVHVSQRLADRYAEKDASVIVIDEVVGMWLALFGASLLGLGQDWVWVLLTFLLFRLFDVVKAGPVGWLDKHVQGGLGVMVDDLLAGLLAALTVTLISIGWAQLSG
ncbi:MAG: phosphatidylglycerophosphatase A [Pseudomonadota bacterium]